MLEGSFVTRKLGPLPVWAWMGLGLGGALALSSWRSNKVDSAAAEKEQTQPERDYGTAYDPYVTFVDADVTNVTYPAMPPGGGRPPVPPGGPTGTPPPAVNTPVPSTPKPSTSRPAPPPAPAGGYLLITTPYRNTRRKGTQDTIWGLAEKAYGDGKYWRLIWDAPQNAAIRQKRKAPEYVQVGDRFWYPKK